MSQPTECDASCKGVLFSDGTERAVLFCPQPETGEIDDAMFHILFDKFTFVRFAQLALSDALLTEAAKGVSRMEPKVVSIPTADGKQVVVMEFPWQEVLNQIFSKLD